MNNKLLIAVLATAFSGITLATETPNYDKLPVDIQQHCMTNNTEVCQEIAAFMLLIEESKSEPTEEQRQKGNELLAALKKEMEPKEGIVTIKETTIFEAAHEEAQEAAVELAEKLATPQE